MGLVDAVPHRVLGVWNSANALEATALHATRSTALIAGVSLLSCPVVVLSAFALTNVADTIESSADFPERRNAMFGDFADVKDADAKFVLSLCLIQLLGTLPFVPTMCAAVVVMYGWERMRAPVLRIGLPFAVLHVLIFVGAALHELHTDQSAVWQAVWRVATYGEALVGVVFLTRGVGAKVGEPRLWQFAVAIALVTGVLVVVYTLAVFPAVFANGFVTSLLLRTVVQSAIKRAALKVVFVGCGWLPRTPRAVVATATAPTIFFVAFAGRLVQVSSNNLLFVVVSEAGCTVLELVDVYSLLRRDRPLALARDVVGYLRGGARGKGNARAEFFSDTRKPTRKSSPPADGAGRPSEGAGAVELQLVGGAGNPSSSPQAGDEAAGTEAVAPNNDMNNNTNNGNDDPNKGTVHARNWQEDTFFGLVVQLFGLAEGVATILTTVFMLIVRVNPRTVDGPPLSASTVLRNAGVVFLFEVFVADTLTTFLSAKYGSRLGLVDLSAAWDNRPPNFLRFVSGSAGVFCIFIMLRGFQAMCLVSNDGRAMFTRCE